MERHPDGVECEMVDVASMETLQTIDVPGLSNCTYGAAPIFVFRSSLKVHHHRPLFFTCRSVVQCVDGRLMKRRRRPIGLRCIVGCKRKCGFLDSLEQQGPVKLCVISIVAVRDGLRTPDP